MKFVTFADDGQERAGVLDGTTVHPLPAGVTLLSLLGDAGSALRRAGEAALAGAEDGRALAGLRLLAPIPRPPTVRDFMTFESHFAGARGLDNPIPPQWYETPAFYFTNPYAILGPADPVPMAPGSMLFDLELEVGAVIGQGGSDLHPDEAETHIAGFTLFIDWSARDLQVTEMQVGLGPAKGKDTATTLGPVLVTPDELEPYRSQPSYGLDMEVHINGERLGGDRLDSMAWSFGDMIAYASRGTRVEPGDVLGSGTCGEGCLAEMWGRHGFEGYPALQPGDEVTVEVEAIGAMTLTVTEGAEPTPIPRARTAN